MADRVHVKDLDHLIHFREQLIQFNRTLDDAFRRIEGAWSQQQSNWSDPQADRLGAELAELWAGIGKYLEHSPEHEHYLRRLIEHLDAARSLRM